MKPIFSRTLLTLLLAVSAQPLLGRAALAQDTTTATAHDAGSLTVKARVSSGCEISLTGGGTNVVMDFGNIGLTSVDKDTNSSFTLQCTAALPYTIGLGAGESTSSTVAARRMTKRASATSTDAATGTGSADVITYQLYRSTADRTAGIHWTQGGAGTLASPTGGATGAAQVINIYGRVPVPTALLSEGFYQDVVRIFLNY